MRLIFRQIKFFSDALKHAKNEQGATMIEFSLTAVIVIGLIGVAFDIGIALFRYNLITQATAKYSREIASDLDVSKSGISCEELFQDASEKVTNFIKNDLKMNGNYRFFSEIEVLGSGAQVYRLKGNWKADCIICLLSPKEINLSTTSETLIENRSFYCI